MDSLLSTAVAAAEAAADVHQRYFGTVDLAEVEEKAPSDFVSNVDLEAQEAAISVILDRFPGHSVLAEEEGFSGAHPTTGGNAALRQERTWPEDGTYLWVIDPLDGTTNYLHGHPAFGASVGVGRKTAQRGEDFLAGLEAGAVVAPRTGERWWARRGEGAFKDGKPIRVSTLQSVEKALIGTGFPFKVPELAAHYAQELARVLPASGGVRRCGSAALDLCYLAEGILDAFWEEAYLSPWDIAAGLLILQEAGGVATRLDGSDLTLENGSVLAANNLGIHEALGTLVRG
jgi:myo-inositol-1(or 4)-monophosphatase